MKCTEYFYSKRQADDFVKALHNNAEPETIKTIDEDTGDDLYIVYYIPPKL